MDTSNAADISFVDTQNDFDGKIKAIFAGDTSHANKQSFAEALEQGTFYAANSVVRGDI